MKKVFLYLFACLLCLACEDRADEDSIILDREILEFPSEGGTLSFNIISNLEWDVITSGRSDSIAVSQRHGTGNQTISVTLPNNTYTVAVEKLIGVRAANGVTKNVIIHQTSKNGSDKLFRVIPGLKYISGKAGTELKVLAICMAPRCFWAMNDGPSWLEVTKDGGKTWASAASQISSSYIEGVDLIFRAVSDNTDQKDREANFKIYYGSEEPDELTIIQLGSNRVAVESSGVLADGIAFSWIYGRDAKEFYVNLTEADIDLSSISTTTIRQWPKFQATEDLMTWHTQLKESTKYYLYIVTKDKKGGLIRARRSYTTSSSQYQPEARIEGLRKDGDAWKWSTVMNEFSGGYNMWVTTDSKWFDYPDAALAWYINQNLGDMDSFHESQNHVRKADQPFMIVTWAYDAQGISSGVLHRQIVGK